MNNSKLTDAEFCRVMMLLKDQWDRCMEAARNAGLTEEAAAAATGAAMTAWLDNRHAI